MKRTYFKITLELCRRITQSENPTENEIIDGVDDLLPLGIYADGVAQIDDDKQMNCYSVFLFGNELPDKYETPEGAASRQCYPSDIGLSFEGFS